MRQSMARIIYPHLSQHLASRLEHDYTSRLLQNCHEIFYCFRKSVQIFSLGYEGRASLEWKILWGWIRWNYRIVPVPLDRTMLLPTETATIHPRFSPASVEGTMLLLWIKWILLVLDAKMLDKVWRTGINTILRRLRSRVRPWWLAPSTTFLFQQY